MFYGYRKVATPQIDSQKTPVWSWNVHPEPTLTLQVKDNLPSLTHPGHWSLIRISAVEMEIGNFSPGVRLDGTATRPR
jgi:hypothetical protein